MDYFGEGMEKLRLADQVISIQETDRSDTLYLKVLKARRAWPVKIKLFLQRR